MPRYAKVETNFSSSGESSSHSDSSRNHVRVVSLGAPNARPTTANNASARLAISEASRTSSSGSISSLSMCIAKPNTPANWHQRAQHVDAQLNAELGEG